MRTLTIDEACERLRVATSASDVVVTVRLTGGGRLDRFLVPVTLPDVPCLLRPDDADPQPDALAE